MGRAYCGVCGEEWLSDCECETIARERFDLAKESWRRLRADLVNAGLIVDEIATYDLDAMFFAGEECPAMPAAPTAAAGEDSCT